MGWGGHPAGMMQNITVQQILAIWVPVTFILHLGLWMFLSPYMPEVPEKVLGLLQGMLGLHAGWAAMIINFYFSSSASSARKDAIIAASSPPPRAPEAP